MEHLVLKVLNFDLSVPSTHIFISKIIESAPQGYPNKVNKQFNQIWYGKVT